MSAPALLAVAHGSRHAGHARTLSALVAAVRRRRPDLDVGLGFLELSQPPVAGALDALVARGHDRVVVVPLLLGEAYHSRVDLPRQLRAAAARQPALDAVQTPVLGPHPLLDATLDRRLREAGAEPGRPGTALVLAAAGSSDPTARAAVGRLAARLAAAGWGRTVPAYASAAAPTPAEAVAALRRDGARRVVVATYLLAPGRFSEELAGAGADVVTSPLGAAPEVARLVLDRYDAVAGADAASRSEALVALGA